MTTLEMFRRLFEYERWAERQAFESVATVWGSNETTMRALKVFSHIVGAHRIWLARLEQNGASIAQPWPTLALE